MYPHYCDIESAETPETIALREDQIALGALNDDENWYVTEAWAAKFRDHFAALLPLAEAGNPLAQYQIAGLLMLGYRQCSLRECEENYPTEVVQMSSWLERAARQGVVVAVDNLITSGVGAEAERLRKITAEVERDRANGQQYLIGETWRRAYGMPKPETSES
jgi:hypothetical protein